MEKFSPIVFVRLFHRWSGIFLILFVGLKILSGYVAAGNIEVLSQEMAYRIHYALWIDIPLLFLFIFHSLYGLFKIINPYVGKNKITVFWIITSLAIVLFLVALIFIYMI